MIKYKSPQHKQDSFYKDLKSLLLKYEAYLSIDDNYVGYSTNPKIIVEFNYDTQFVEEFDTGVIPDLDLGRHESGE